MYGTFIGAGVVSVVATCGGTVFQHFFKRTGEQLREVTVQAKSGARQVPVVSPYKRGRDRTAPPPPVDAERTQLLGRPDPADAERTQFLGQVDLDAGRTHLLPRADADRTRLLKTLGPGDLPPGAAPAKEFNEASVHGTRLRGWKRPLLAAAVVFGMSMGGITAYELIAGGEARRQRRRDHLAVRVHRRRRQAAALGSRARRQRRSAQALARGRHRWFAEPGSQRQGRGRGRLIDGGSLAVARPLVLAVHGLRYRARLGLRLRFRLRGVLDGPDAHPVRLRRFVGHGLVGSGFVRHGHGAGRRRRRARRLRREARGHPRPVTPAPQSPSTRRR